MKPFTLLFILFFALAIIDGALFLFFEKAKPSISKYIGFGFFALALIDFVLLILFFADTFKDYGSAKAIWSAVFLGLFIASLFFAPFSKRLGEKAQIIAAASLFLTGFFAFFFCYQLGFALLGNAGQ